MPFDGSLYQWNQISELHEWNVLLLGNGLSVNIWPNFAYGSLFEYVRGGGLTPGDLALFDDPPNFERVLGDLSTAIRVAQVVGVDVDLFYEHYRRIQLALGYAIRQVHLHRLDAPDHALTTIRNEMLNYEWIFTTSYDLLIYWAMGCGGTFRPFVDLFKYGTQLRFDPQRAEVAAGEIPVYFLHGALHLVAGGTGVTSKLKRSVVQTLLDQFGQPMAGDPQARPLLVTEGSARQKLRAIESNDYLAHALRRLRDTNLPMVIFGSTLGPEDQHLVDALNEHPARPIAISMYPRTQSTLRERQGQIYGRLQSDELLFFDSTSHPLGSPALRAP